MPCRRSLRSGFQREQLAPCLLHCAGASRAFARRGPPLACRCRHNIFWRRRWDSRSGSDRSPGTPTSFAHLEAAGGGDWTDARRASALVSALGREGQRKYFADEEQEAARQLTSAASASSEAARQSTGAASSSSDAVPPASEFPRLLERLDRLFAASTNVLAERHEFTSRKQFEGEGFLEFVTALKEKAVQCNFGTAYNERVRDQIIHGVANVSVREKLLAHGETLSLDKAEEIGRSLEALHRANRAFGSENVGRIEASQLGVPSTGQDGRLLPGSRQDGRRSPGGHEDGRLLPGSRQEGRLLPGSRQEGRLLPGSRRDHGLLPGSRRDHGLLPRGRRDHGLLPRGRRDHGLLPRGRRDDGHFAHGSSGNRGACDRCGSAKHIATYRNCPARNRRCNACHTLGHFASVCRKTRTVQYVSSAETLSSTSAGQPSASVLTVSAFETKKDLEVPVVVNGVSMRLPVDTGASVSMMTVEDFGKHFGRQHRLSQTVDLKNFSKQCIDIQGLFQATVQFFQKSCSVMFHVTTTGTSLLGLDAIQRLGIQIDGTSLTCRLPSLPSVQSPTGAPPGLDHLSSDELGLVNNFVHRIHRQQDAKPVSSKLRRLPLALRDQVTHELRRLEDCDVIERVEATEWVSPLVVVRKKDGTMRLCVDLREQDSLVPQVQERVLQKQSQTKPYVDKRRGAQATRIKVGDTVRIRFNRKGFFKYSKPRKVKAQIGPSTFLLSDGKTWHVSKLTVVMKDPAGSTLCTSDRDFLYSYSNLDSHSDDLSVVTASSHSHKLQLSCASDCITSESTQSAVVSDSVGQLVASQDLLGRREELPGQPSPALSDNHIQFSNQGEVNNSGTTRSLKSTDTRRNPQSSSEVCTSPHRVRKRPPWLDDFVYVV
ncbi:uncharacterized protein [Dermacentor andersoni]|uniref:uncharacterized protein n=1 Tax=Dermacentor andersoni TaxID=34620 RepID=UPI003B3B23D3